MRKLLSTKLSWLADPDKRRLLATALLLGVIGLIVVAALGIYVLGWQNGFSHTLSKAVPYPAAYAGRRVITYRQYMDEIRYLAARHQYARDTGLTEFTPSESEFSTQAMSRLINAAFVEQWANEHSLAVSEDEIRRQLDAPLLNSNENETLWDIGHRYGLSEALLVEQTRRELLFHLAGSRLPQDFVSGARDQAIALLDRINTGENFDELALEQSDYVGALDLERRYRDIASRLPETIQVELEDVETGKHIDRVVGFNGHFYIVRRDALLDGEPTASVILIKPLQLSQWLSLRYEEAPPLHFLPHF